MKNKICEICGINPGRRDYYTFKILCPSCKIFSDENREVFYKQKYCMCCDLVVSNHKNYLDHCESLEHKEKSRKNRRESTSKRATDSIINRENDWGRSKIYYPYRTKWEYVFSLYLSEKNIPVIYEEEAFKLEDYNGDIIHYIPDFFIKNIGYIEICSTYNLRNNKKVTLFSKQYPLLHIEIWTPKTFLEQGLVDKYVDILQRKNVNV